jgi:hypothetical protein
MDILKEIGKVALETEIVSCRDLIQIHRQIVLSSQNS